MDLNIEMYEQIDRYLLGELSDEEKLKFEQLMVDNPDLTQAVEDQETLLRAMDEHEESVETEQKMDKFHKDLDKSTYQIELTRRGKVISRRRRIFSTISIAASVSIITFISSWFIITKKQIKKIVATNELKDRIEELSGEVEKALVYTKEVVDSISAANETRPQIEKYSFGTCIPINDNGLFVTSLHLVKNGKRIALENQSLYPNKKLSATLIYQDETHDLGLIQVKDSGFALPAQLPYTFKSGQLDLGREIFTLGYPKQDIVYGDGSISSFTGFKSDTTTFQLSIPVNPGNSGGPIFSERGDVLGIITARHSSQMGSAYAVKTKHVEDLIDKYYTAVEEEVNLSTKNRVSRLSKTDRIKTLGEFVFRVKVYRPLED